MDQTPLLEELVSASCRLSGSPRTRDAGKKSEPRLPPQKPQNLFFLTGEVRAGGGNKA